MVFNKGMRIGELAEIVGVSTRTVRHYHHEGLLPEPARDTNGYRRYAVSDLTTLLRIRRLRELGLSVDDIRRVLNNVPERGLGDVLSELDQDLEAQERSIAAMRRRIHQLLADGELDTLSKENGLPSHGVFLRLKELGAEGQAYRTDQTLMSALPDKDAHDWSAAWQQLLSETSDAEELASSYVEFDALVSAQVNDPRVHALVERIWELMPQDYLDGLSVDESQTPGAGEKALAESLSPAQAKVMELLVQRMSRHRELTEPDGCRGDEETA